MNIDFLDTLSYTLYLSSNDKVSGTNNNATFNVNWDSFLTRDYDQFKVCYSFLTAGGYYKDTANSNFNNCKIVADFAGRSLSYNTATNASSTILGYGQRDMQTTASSSNSFATFFYQFPAKTIARPNQNNFNVRIYNAGKQNNSYNQLLVDTDTNGVLQADMSVWSMVIEFIPTVNSERKKLYSTK